MKKTMATIVLSGLIFSVGLIQAQEIKAETTAETTIETTVGTTIQTELGATIETETETTTETTMDIEHADTENSLSKTAKTIKGWTTVKGKTYYYKNGKVVTGFQTIGKSTYYFTKKGVMRTGLRTIEGKKYYFGTDGIMKTKWQTIGTKKYYFHKTTGEAYIGWNTISKKTYYFSKAGVVKRGLTSIGGKDYYFDTDGVMQTGFQILDNVTWYFEPTEGCRLSGWQTIEGSQHYFDPQKGMLTGIQTIENTYYFFDEKGVYNSAVEIEADGTLVSGWQERTEGTCYYQSGLRLTGWQTIEATSYYFNSQGVMQTGFVTIGKKTYFLKAKGGFATGFKEVGENTYFFTDTGIMVTGWKMIEGKQYYFSETGIMAKGTTVVIEDAYSVFDVNGVYVPEKSYYLVNGNVKVHLQYKTDPQVDTATLLAAIIQCEAGNQREFPVITNDGTTVYKGMVGVGYVIANRLSATKSYKEVIYQLSQFQPARTGTLTKLLQDTSAITKDCINAAKVVMDNVSTGEEQIKEFKRADFTWQNFWAVSYANTTDFYSVYDETIGECETMQGHVFFNYTKTITSKKTVAV